MSDQLALDSWNATNAPELERVKSKIGNEVLAFCRWKMQRVSLNFTMADLAQWVRSQLGVAPDSPGRILRDLRQRGHVRYTVLSRKDSLYRIDFVAP